MDAGSAQRQLQVQFTVPLTATTVASVSLTAIGSAAGLHTDPEASASVTVLAPPTPIGVTASLPALAPIGVSAPTPTLSPGGNASGLFPTLDPQPAPQSPATEGARQVANTASAYTGSASTVGAQVVGLAALALAFLLAVTRLSIRRPALPAPGTAVATTPPPAAPAESPEQPEDPTVPPAALPDVSKDSLRAALPGPDSASNQ